MRICSRVVFANFHALPPSSRVSSHNPAFCPHSGVLPMFTLISIPPFLPAPHTPGIVQPKFSDSFQIDSPHPFKYCSYFRFPATSSHYLNPLLLFSLFFFCLFFLLGNTQTALLVQQAISNKYANVFVLFPVSDNMLINQPTKWRGEKKICQGIIFGLLCPSKNVNTGETIQIRTDVACLLACLYKGPWRN